jgi:hypothetical protein
MQLKEDEMKFTQEHIHWFNLYYRVQLSGKYNMFDPRARQETGLSRSAYDFVMDHYSELREAREAQNE